MDWVYSLRRSGEDYIITGESYRADNALAGDVLLAKVDASGKVLWKQSIDGGLSEVGISSCQTRDGGYLIVGSSFQQTETSGDTRGYIVKTDREGHVVWDKLYNSSSFWVGIDVIENQDGYLVLGKRNARLLGLRQQVVLLAIDSKGVVIWERMYGGEEMEYPAAMTETADGYLIVGQTASYPDEDGNEHVYLLMVDRQGEVLWEKTLPRPAFEAVDVVAAPAGGFLVAGSATLIVNGKNDSQAWVGKIDDSGELIWSAITGSGPGGDGAFDLAITPDSGAIFAGYAETERGHTDGYLVKVNGQGEIEWEMTLDNTAEADGILLMQDGGYFVTGVAGPTNPDNVRDDSSIYFIKLKPEDLPAYRFLRGDVDRNEEVNLADAISLLDYLFRGEEKVPCLDAGDTDDNGELNISDSLYLLNHLFRAGPTVAPPFPEVGVDLTLDSLGCLGP